MTGKTAFVTGSTGFVGVNLVAALRSAGWEVTALHRKSSDTTHLASLGATLAVGDITDRASLERTMPDDVDAVFHVAASLSLNSRGDADQTRINVDGTRNVVEVALAKGAKRFVHTSSMAAYGLQSGAVDETTASTALASPINYFRTKRLAEEEVEKGVARGLNAVIVNPSNVVGPFDTHGWARVFKLVRDGKLPGIGPGSGSFCHVREVVAAHLAAAERGRTGERYLLGGTDASYLEFVQTIQKEVGGKAPKTAMPPALFKLAARILPIFARLSGREPDVTPEVAALFCMRAHIKSDKAATELGYKTVPLDEMVRDAADWLKREGLLSA